MKKACVASFIAKYSPALAGELRATRARLRKMFPRGYELVYDNYNALVFGFSSSERAGDAILSIAGYPRWVTLFFLDGVRLKDPKGLLEGGGRQVRSVRLDRVGRLDHPDIRSLIEQAIAPHRSAFRAAKPLKTVVKSISAKQRPRRPATARARPAGP